MVKILFFGDIVGKAGRQAVAEALPELKLKHKPDLVLANVENLAHGKGVTLSTLQFMIDNGVDFFTSGNHVFDKPQGKEVFEKFAGKIIRPANWEVQFPGKGYEILQINSQPVLIINLLGQVFMASQIDEGQISNPFLKLNEILAEQGTQTRIRILDFHAEATSEKRAMGFWADGRLSAVLGTHTHIATADAQILPLGTGYLTDIGMTGAYHSVIGCTVESVLKRFEVGEGGTKPPPLEVAESGPSEVSYCVLEIDEASGKCQNIVSKVQYAAIPQD